MKIFLAIIIALPFFCLGQKQGNIWYFGEYAGLDFNTGIPVNINNGQLTAGEGTAVMCDSSGALLFYTNGFQIWNKNHQVMPNGDTLGSSFYLSSTQAALIIPQPGSSRFFYVFTTDDFIHQLQNGLRYSIVDICLDNGFGDIIVNQKNILLLDLVAEKLTGVRHINGTDYWVITHKYFSDAFYAYHLSAAGIIDTVISHIGSVHPTNSVSLAGALGQLKASPNGEMLATVYGNVTGIAEYFNFDKATGVVSNFVSLDPFPPGGHYYGVSFSPDNSKLYIACTMNCNAIYQYDLNSGGGNPDSVKASKTQVAFSYNYLALQLASDGKIYTTRAPFGGIPYLGVINNPNDAGLSCNYIDSAIYLNGHFSWHGLPNFIDSYDYSNTTYNCQTGINDGYLNEINVVFTNPFSDFLKITINDNRIYNILLYDIGSRKLLEESFLKTCSLNTEQLAKGIYLYEIWNKEGMYKNGKIVKH